MLKNHKRNAKLYQKPQKKRKTVSQAIINSRSLFIIATRFLSVSCLSPPFPFLTVFFSFEIFTTKL